ncbi:uncharacterized protein LOC121263127 isoform X2 [Juglans microcarpa x Juglans regia]|uniref:uncharacterized protein LOC121263127 isoform X2 n=1 Tax=Juglans microcarpa x Juglans regia TaxID=2249226 RepID=UPI001B7F2237|nr:uncharacterized protein LOC121263127 isoform X2 [Juglans microcarpa x Juglans regia]
MAMASIALPAFALLPSTPKFRDQPCQQRCLRLHGHHQLSPTCSMKVSMAEFGEPNKVKMQINVAREKLWEATPDSVKEIPWKKAEKILLERLLLLGQNTLKWTLVIFFIFSSLYDVIFSISRNQELIIPCGLFVGCLMTNFLKEISNELFRNSEEQGLNWQLVGIGCFFVLLKFLSGSLVLPARLFLFHFANGGLMQLLWLWRSLPEEREK